ncbi:hypothetical protein [Vibrio crassostreae]|uniref:hypothetical protein n=1 Tax=Vibrio crassostreae TaxID=246167 RepID=UPI001B30C6C7|nr:hypothetical protein [Vibrio crassostreae]
MKGVIVTMVSNRPTSNYLLIPEHLELVLKVVKLVIKSRSILPKKSELPPATLNHMNVEQVTHVLKTVKLVNDISTKERDELEVSAVLGVTTPKLKKRDVGNDETQN